MLIHGENPDEEFVVLLAAARGEYIRARYNCHTHFSCARMDTQIFRRVDCGPPWQHLFSTRASVDCLINIYILIARC